MAKCSMSGFDELAADLKKLEQLDNDELIGEMLDAGAEIVVREWRKEIQKVVKGKRSTGALLDSVTSSEEVFHDSDGVPAMEIYPDGRDDKGVRNIEKAFILHYGKSGQTPTFFVDDVEAAAEDEAVEAMSEVFNDFLKKEGL